MTQYVPIADWANGTSTNTADNLIYTNGNSSVIGNARSGQSNGITAPTATSASAHVMTPMSTTAGGSATIRPTSSSAMPTVRPSSLSPDIAESLPRTASIDKRNSELITYIFPDFNAVDYFQKEFVTSTEFFSVEEAIVTGFDVYLVEQWVNERRIGTVVATYTGNLASKITATKFTIIRKQLKHYPAKFQEYLNELVVNHAKIKRMDEKLSRRSSEGLIELPTLTSIETGSAIDEGSTSDKTNEVCFVTNLASLPSILNLVPLASGDSREIMRDFVINSNLKKLNCSGRSLYLTTERISDANEDKFRQMYKILNPNVPIKFAIRELVNIIQTSLFYFDLLDPKYCDGLLCNKTEEAISNWWNLVGLPHFNIKPGPADGKLPARSVSAIISLVLSIKLRLHIIGGCDVPKDPFDFESFMISIGQFQKQYKLEKKRKLDLETMNKLFTVTNAKLLPERHANYYHTSPNPTPNQASSIRDSYMDQLDILDDSGLSPTTSYSPRLAQTPKKKGYYSKEFKKLTNVVKSTLESKDYDESVTPSTGGRIRNTIAKLSDTISPLEVETLDLEHLTKHYLMGKSLLRLFHGTFSNTMRNGELPDEIFNARKKNYNRGHQNAAQFQFCSLKDNIKYNQGLGIPGGRYPISDLSKYSRGFNRMKIGLQNRRHLLSSTNRGGENSGRRPDNSYYAQPNVVVGRASHHSLRPSTGEPGTDFENHDLDSIRASISSTRALRDPLEQFQSNLNRRNSYPCLIEKHERNLNLLAFSKKDNFVKPILLTSKRRSISFSRVEEFILNKSGDGELLTMDKFTDKYLSTINNLLKFETLQHHYDDEVDDKAHKRAQEGNIVMEEPWETPAKTNANIRRNYKVLNLDLVKVKNAMKQMSASKAKIIDEDFVGNLQYNIKDLSTITDRLLYETRIVTKRIDELEENYKLLDVKLNHDCKTKMTNIITATINLKKFNEVFASLTERDELIMKLVGDQDDVRASIASGSEQSEVNPSGMVMQIFQNFIRFIYEMVLFVSLLFKFNRAQMNLDRIRETWVKLDPNRSIINRAYSYVGREPPRDHLDTDLHSDDPLFRKDSNGNKQ